MKSSTGISRMVWVPVILWASVAPARNVGAQVEQVKLIAFDGARGDGFGNSMALGDDVIVVGVKFDDDAGDATGSAYLFGRDQGGPGAWGLVMKINSPESQAGDRFGGAVAISGETLVIGARDDDDFGERSGSVYVLERHAGGHDAWGVVAKITPFDSRPFDLFGGAVAIEGDLIVVGAAFVGNDTVRGGGAFVFSRNAGGPGAWGQVGRLIPSDAASLQLAGWNVDVSGDVAIVSAHGDRHAGEMTGAAYIFQRDAGGQDQWGQVSKLVASDALPSDRFGFSVAIHGDLAIAGAPGRNGWQGAAYVYDRHLGGTNQWGQVAKLLDDQPFGFERFGLSVEISRQVAAVGVPSDFTSIMNFGSTEIFGRNEGGRNQWGHATTARAAEPDAGDFFGVFVGLERSRMVVGATLDDDAALNAGAAYLFDDLLPGLTDDCNHNGISDDLELSLGDLSDCNLNGSPDVCDIASGVSSDENRDRVPDECIDCNGNGRSDIIDLHRRDSQDEDGDGIPDECAPPFCQGLEATIWVGLNGLVQGGRFDGMPYFGILLGTHRDDVIVGTDGPDIIIGLKGDDVICAGAGDDFINGNHGNDSIDGGAGRDRVRGNGGTDTCINGEKVAGCEG